MTPRFDDDEPVQTFHGLSQARCTELLHSQTVGRVAWQGASGPEILPVTFTWYDDTVLFRTSPYGPLSDLVQPTDVAFEIDEIDQQYRRGWSVVIHGRAAAVAESEKLSELWTAAGVPWAPGSRNLLIQITPRTVTGREVAARMGDD